MSENIIFEEKDNGAWGSGHRAGKYSPGRFIVDVDTGKGSIIPGDLLLTKENLIFKGRKDANWTNKEFDMTIPLENAFRVKKDKLVTSRRILGIPLSSTSPSFLVASVSGEVLAHFQSKKSEENNQENKKEILTLRRPRKP